MNKYYPIGVGMFVFVLAYTFGTALSRISCAVEKICPVSIWSVEVFILSLIIGIACYLMYKD